MAYYYDGINMAGYCFKDSAVIDGIQEFVWPLFQELVITISSY